MHIEHFERFMNLWFLKFLIAQFQMKQLSVQTHAFCTPITGALTRYALFTERDATMEES